LYLDDGSFEKTRGAEDATRAVDVSSKSLYPNFIVFTTLVMSEESLGVVTNVGIGTYNLKPMIEGEYTT